MMMKVEVCPSGLCRFYFLFSRWYLFSFSFIHLFNKSDVRAWIKGIGDACWSDLWVMKTLIELFKRQLRKMDKHTDNSSAKAILWDWCLKG